jgi:hypothetical protein
MGPGLSGDRPPSDARDLRRCPATSRRVAVRHDGAVLPRVFRDARDAILALHDSLFRYRGKCRRARRVAFVPVLGCGVGRAAGDRDLHDWRLLAVPRQDAEGLRLSKPRRGPHRRHSEVWQHPTGWAAFTVAMSGCLCTRSQPSARDSSNMPIRPRSPLGASRPMHRHATSTLTRKGRNRAPPAGTHGVRSLAALLL